MVSRGLVDRTSIPCSLPVHDHRAASNILNHPATKDIPQQDLFVRLVFKSTTTSTLPVTRMRIPPLPRALQARIRTIAHIKVRPHLLVAPLRSSVLRVPVCALVLQVPADPLRRRDLGVVAAVLDVEVVLLAVAGLPLSGAAAASADFLAGGGCHDAVASDT